MQETPRIDLQETASVERSFNPYRVEGEGERFCFSAEERAEIAKTARWMIVAGVVGVVAFLIKMTTVVAVAGATSAVSFSSLVWMGLPAFLAIFVWSAGRSLKRVSSAKEEYQTISEALGRLGLVFRLRGIVFLVLIALVTSVFVANFIGSFVR